MSDGEGSSCLPYGVEMLVMTCRRLLCMQNVVKAFKASAKAPVELSCRRKEKLQMIRH